MKGLWPTDHRMKARLDPGTEARRDHGWFTWCIQEQGSVARCSDIDRVNKWGARSSRFRGLEERLGLRGLGGEVRRCVSPVCWFRPKTNRWWVFWFGPQNVDTCRHRGRFLCLDLVCFTPEWVCNNIIYVLRVE
jgi:hypothetical protein